MADTNRQLNMTVMSTYDQQYPLASPSGIGVHFGFESARGAHDSAELLMSSERGPLFQNTANLETNYMATEMNGDGDHSMLSSVEVSPRESTMRRLNTSDPFANTPDMNNAVSSRT